ncbi:MAG: zinc-ribbon domain-containing protein [Candidatus Cloacimonetes bacterium]|nr:zinc-ribbon domain-containing protein [Candidatus Cloacimonadota bacterium]
MFCTQCGNQLSEDRPFCTKCGKKVNEPCVATTSSSPTKNNTSKETFSK